MKYVIRPLLLIFLLVASIMDAQVEFSMHKYHSELYGIDEDLPSKFPPDAKIIPLQPKPEKELSSVVFGYLPDWEYSNNNYQGMHYDLLTHIACFDFFVSGDGSMTNPAMWPWVDVINTAHANGVKIILTAVTFDKDDIRSLIDNASARNTLFQNIKNRISAYNMDGVNIDFESLYSADQGDRINGFMAELTEFIHNELPGKEVSFAGPAINWGNTWKLGGLAQSCDYIFIMGYAFAGSWSSVTSPNAPVTGTTYSISNTIYTQYAEVVNSTPEKIILGVPYYGLRWETETQYENSPTIDFLNSPRYKDAYTESFSYGRKWSTKYKNSWYSYNSAGWHQVWYDDSETLVYKYDIVLNKNLMGTGMWALGYDNGREELWSLLDTKFGSGQSVPPSAPMYFYAEGLAGNMIRITADMPVSAYSFMVYYKKSDALVWDSLVTSTADISVHNLQTDGIYYVKIKAGNAAGFSRESETLSAIPAGISNRVLIVNGFDREIGNNENTHDFIKYYTEPLRYNNFGYSSASNEAVVNNLVDLNDYKTVIWILGEESTSDDTFNALEMILVKEYLKQGGNLFVSGAEIGWELGREGFSNAEEMQFYNEYLKAEYLTDAPKDESATYYGITPETGIFEDIEPFSFDNGTFGTYDVEYPDAITGINGAENVLFFTGTNPETDGYAGIKFEGLFPAGTTPGKLVYFTFPFETVIDSLTRHDLMKNIMEFFSTPSILENGEDVVKEFKLRGNYPNPFNPETTIEFVSPEISDVRISFYNMLGERVDLLENIMARAGVNNIKWRPDASLSSGIYLYKIDYKSEKNFGSIAGKLNFIK